MCDDIPNFNPNQFIRIYSEKQASVLNILSLIHLKHQSIFSTQHHTAHSSFKSPSHPSLVFTIKGVVPVHQSIAEISAPSLGILSWALAHSVNSFLFAKQLACLDAHPEHSFVFFPASFCWPIDFPWPSRSDTRNACDGSIFLQGPGKASGKFAISIARGLVSAGEGFWQMKNVLGTFKNDYELCGWEVGKLRRWCKEDGDLFVLRAVAQVSGKHY